MASLISDTPSIKRCRLCTPSNSKIAISLSWDMGGPAYDQVLTQLAEDYEFIIRDNKLSIWLKIKAIARMFLTDWLDRCMPSQNLYLPDY